MDAFKNIHEYYKHLKKLQLQAKAKLETINLKEISEFTEQKKKDVHYLLMNAHPALLEIVKERLSDELFDHLNGFDLTLELDIADLFMISDAIQELNLHRSLNMSHDGNRFLAEIKNLKSDANRIHSLSNNKNLEIRLPNSSHSIKYLLHEYFVTRGKISKDSIKNISLFFSPSKPRAGVKSTEMLYESYDKIGKQIIDNMQNEIDINTLYNSIDDENSIYAREIKKTEFYTPDDDC